MDTMRTERGPMATCSETGARELPREEGNGQGLRAGGGVLLIYPPCTMACEPPAGIAKLAGALSASGASYHLLDANLEGLLALADRQQSPVDTWTRRALSSRERNLQFLRTLDGYAAPARYGRAVRDLERLVATAHSGESADGSDDRVTVSLANFRHARLSPLRSADLLTAAQHPRSNPFYGYFSARLRELVEHLAPSVVGLSLMYLSQALTAFAMLGYLRACFPNLRLAVGGGLVTSWQSRVNLREKFGGLVDAFIAGPGEQAVLELGGVSAGGGAPWGAPGGDRLTLTQPQRCPPRFDGLPLGDYLSPGLILPFAASTGCWWRRCGFCPERAEESRYGGLPVTVVREQLQALIERHRPLMVHFTDNAIPPVLLRSLAERPLGVPWYGFVRVGKELADPAFCQALARGGCVMLKVGVESGSDAVLANMSKGFNTLECQSTLRSVQAAGIATYVYLLFGTPGETTDEAQETVRFVERNAEHVSFLNLAVFNLPTHAPEALQLETSPFYDGDLSLYTDFVHPTGFGRRQVKAFIDRELRRNPRLSPIIARDPPIFSSNHAAVCLLARRAARRL